MNNNRYNNSEQNNFRNEYSGYNEYSFYPQNDPGRNNKKKSRAMGSLLAVTTVIALCTTSLIGYTLISQNNRVDMANTGSGTDSFVSDSTNDSDPTETVRTNIPTLTQLASPEDALSIPEIVEKVSPSVVGISSTYSQDLATGTGIIMSEDGYILTNAHVVSGAIDVSVVLSKELDSEQLDAEIIGCDDLTDIAVLKVDKDDLPAAEFGISSDLVVGEVAVVIGHPLGFELQGSVTAGIISALDRELTVEDREMQLIQTDASINSGNSGGPLINAYGQVVGITSAKINSTYGEGLGFAIPIDNAMPIVEDLMKYGYVKGRPLVGISGENITEIYSQYYGIPQGFIVRSVTEGSGADKAGIVEGDIIIGINGELITTIEEFNSKKADFKAGDTISVSLYRDGKRMDVDVVLQENKPDNIN